MPVPIGPKHCNAPSSAPYAVRFRATVASAVAPGFLVHAVRAAWEATILSNNPTPEDSARHIIRLLVGHFHAMPGRVLREASLLQILASDGWDTTEFKPGRTYALEHGWLNAATDTLTLTNAGYSAAFTETPEPPASAKGARPK